MPVLYLQQHLVGFLPLCHGEFSPNFPSTSPIYRGHADVQNLHTHIPRRQRSNTFSTSFCSPSLVTFDLVQGPYKSRSVHYLVRNNCVLLATHFPSFKLSTSEVLYTRITRSAVFTRKLLLLLANSMPFTAVVLEACCVTLNCEISLKSLLPPLPFPLEPVFLNLAPFSESRLANTSIFPRELPV
jgi:hypothetical protein